MYLIKNKNILASIIIGAIFLTGCSQNGSKFYNSQTYFKSKFQFMNNNKNGLISQKSEKETTYYKTKNEQIKNSAAMHRATMRPYKVFGKMYYPTLAKVGDTQNGVASWYGPDFHAKKTSNGEIYDMNAQTAAHKTYPMNTMIRVDNLENGKSTIVRINDRGPFVDGRVIDLSNKAANDIDMVKKGTAKVKLTILGFHAKIAQTKEEKNEVAAVGKYYIQVGAFKLYAGALETQRKFKLILDGKYDVIIQKGEINRVWISGFKSEKEAEDFKKENGLQSATIIAG